MVLFQYPKIELTEKLPFNNQAGLRQTETKCDLVFIIVILVLNGKPIPTYLLFKGEMFVLMEQNKGYYLPLVDLVK